VEEDGFEGTGDDEVVVAADPEVAPDGVGVAGGEVGVCADVFGVAVDADGMAVGLHFGCEGRGDFSSVVGGGVVADEEVDVGCVEELRGQDVEQLLEGVRTVVGGDGDGEGGLIMRHARSFAI